MIEPLSRSARARYQRCNWPTRSPAEATQLDPEPVVIIESVNAGRSEWRHQLCFIIWIDTPRAERLRRGLARDGADALDYWETSGTVEDQHYYNDPTRCYAEVVIDGNEPVAW